MDQQKLNELAIQCGGIWRGGHVEQPNGDSVWTEKKWVDPCDMDLNKFAELIVRESMKVTKDYTCNQGWDYSAPVALARHFGVGE